MKRLWVPAAVTAVAALSGCAPLACPAIGYLSVVEVTVSDPTVVQLECVEGCEGGVGHLEETPPTWTIDVGGRPATITVVGHDASGAEVLRETVPLTWTLADPGNACGSSGTADPVNITK